MRASDVAGSVLMKGVIRQWFSENKERLLVLLGVLLVGSLCFEAGLLQGKATPGASLQLTIPAAPSEDISPKTIAPVLESPASAPVLVGEPVAAKESGMPCVFVGSKNSNKYHLATCPVAKRIKLENRICFSSKEEAEKRGYSASCLK